MTPPSLPWLLSSRRSGRDPALSWFRGLEAGNARSAVREGAKLYFTASVLDVAAGVAWGTSRVERVMRRITAAGAHSHPFVEMQANGRLGRMRLGSCVFL